MLETSHEAIHTGLLERGDQLERLGALLARAAGGTGSVALVEGPAGIGKTSILAAGRELAAESGIEALTARAGWLERDLAWNLVRQLFAAVIRASPERRAELLSGASALAAPALGLPGLVTAGAAEDGALHGLYWLAGALVEEQPLLLVVDDAHWGDLPSLRFLAYLAERVADLPALLLVSVRSGEPQPDAIKALAVRAERLTLPELSLNASSELTRAMLGANAAEEFCASCHEVTGGNPFLLNELLAQLERDEIEPSADQAGAVGRVTPESVERMMLLRLSTLEPQARELASAVALLDGRAGMREAASIAGLDPASASRAADQLVRAGLLGPGAPLRFVHPLVREVIYGDLPAHERARRHREAAQKLVELGADLQRVAVQLLSAEPTGDRWAVDQLRAAAAAALLEGADQPAVQFLRRALEEPPEAEARPSVLRALARAEALSGSDDAMAHLELALGETTDASARAEIAGELVLIRFRHGQMAQAIEEARELIETRAIENKVMEMRVLAAAVTGAILLTELRPLVDYFVTRIPDDTDDDSPEGRLALSARLAVACARRAPTSEIGDLAERALGGGSLLAELSANELLYWNATSALTVSDRFGPARRAIDGALQGVQRQGSAIGFALCSCFRAKLNQRTGDLTAGTADGWQAITTAPDDVPLIRAYSAAFLVDCLIDRGELPAALELLRRPEFSHDTPPVFGYQLMRVSRGCALIAAGEVEAGVEEIMAVGEELGEFEFGPAMCPWRASAALGLVRLGKSDLALQLAEQELSRATEVGSGWGRVAALQALAIADPPRAPDALQEAVELSESHGFALEAARSRVLLGSHERRVGHRRRAEQLLNDGLEAAAACGAPAVAQRASKELVAIGLTPRRRQGDMAEALTPAERRVAELAAAGTSNREIAQSLFVSLRTVETHLTHCYQKLGIESRAQLAPVLGSASPVAHRS